MTQASAVSTRGGRITFYVGGGLFVVAGLLALLQTPLTPAFAWASSSLDGYPISMILQQVGGVFAAAAMIVFAVGARSGGSVVARKPLGTTALVVFALWPFVSILVLPLVPYEVMGGLPWLMWTISAIPAVAGLVAVIEIVRVRAVPGLWRWLPAVAYLAVVGTVAFVQVAQGLGWNNGEAYAPIITIPYGIFLFSTFLVPFALGIAGIGLAAAASRREGRRQNVPPPEVPPAEAEPAPPA